MEEGNIAWNPAWKDPVMPLAPELDSALAASGVTIDALPGIEAVWQERFAVLDVPAPETPREVLTRLFPTSAALAATSTVGAAAPIRGGGIQVTVATEDWEDEDDYVPDETLTLTPEQADEYLEALQQAPAQRSRRALTVEREGYTTGDRKLWWLLTGDPHQACVDYRNAYDRHTRATDSVETAQERADLADHIESAIKDLVPLPANEPFTGGGYNRRLNPLTPPKDARDSLLDDKRGISHREVNDLAAALATAEPQLASLDAALKEAESLPAGPLREYLLGERPERSYQSTEGVGRGKKSVTRTYRPTSDLVKDHRSAKDQYDRLDKVRKDILARAAFIKRDAEHHVADRTGELNAAHSARITTFLAGWPGLAPLPTEPAADTAEEL